MMETVRVSEALKLPEEWDSLVADYFQTREFLDHAERHNRCQQRYYLLLDDGRLRMGAVVYTLRIDLFTYRSVPSPIKVNIIGIPCSVSAGGIVGSPDLMQCLLDQLISHEKGLLLGLNLESPVAVPGIISGKTLPTVEVVKHFGSWHDYVHSLRTDYRRRLLSIGRSFEGVRQQRGTCSQFDADMYRLYLDVLKRSKGKLETLSLAFLQNLPGCFSLTSFYHEETLLGWYISTLFHGKFYFFLGGINYEANQRFRTYFNMLFAILREGIEEGASLIDMGQTAEVPKTRLGGTLSQKFMCGYHSNGLVRSVLHLGRHILEYSSTFPETRVFRDGP